jgi:hypothetical protein
MSSYHTFTTSRTTRPDSAALLEAIKVSAEDVNVGFNMPTPTTVTVKKPTDWTSAQISATQNAIDTVPELTPQREAQNQVDSLSMLDKKIILTILDQFNFIRARLPTPLAPISIPQMIQAIRDRDVP